MPMKILTGQIVPRSGNRSRGTATIDFEPHGVSGDANGGSMATTGDGSFDRSPGFILALRDFVAQDRRKGSEDRSEQDRFRIDTIEFNINRLVVEWECETGAEIREISYLIVGEV